jgi:hypothetical protein
MYMRFTYAVFLLCSIGRNINLRRNFLNVQPCLPVTLRVVYGGYCIIAHNRTIAPEIAYSLPLFTPNSSFIRRSNHRSGISSLLLIGCVERHPGPRAPSANCRNIKWGLLNIRSAVNKAAQIQDTIESESLDILVLTETHMLSDAPRPLKTTSLLKDTFTSNWSEEEGWRWYTRHLYRLS